MAYPPAIPSNARLNTTPQVDNHPADHNAVSNALTDIVVELGADPSAGYADLTVRLDAMLDVLSPVGALIPYVGPAAPTGHAMCVAGATASRTGAPKLFTLWGVKYGAGNGSTTFNLPNMQKRSIWGARTPASTWGNYAGNNDAYVKNHGHTVDGGSHDHTFSFSWSTSGTGTHSHTEESFGNLGYGWLYNRAAGGGSNDAFIGSSTGVDRGQVTYGQPSTGSGGSGHDHSGSGSGTTGEQPHSHTVSTTQDGTGVDANVPSVLEVNYIVRLA